MKIIFDRSFGKSLDKLKDKDVKAKIEHVILEAELANAISELSNSKKMQGFKTFYRIRIGDYRIGVEMEAPSVLRFVIVLHRKDIYKKFP